MIRKFRKKPIVVEAVQWLGDNQDKIIKFCSQFKCTKPHDDSLLIYTLEGTMEAKKGDWIIKGVKGEFYPCKTDVFEQTYEEVEEEKNV